MEAFTLLLMWQRLPLEKITKKPLGFLVLFFKRKEFLSLSWGGEGEPTVFGGFFSLFFVLKILSSFYISCFSSIKSICVCWRGRDPRFGRVRSWKIVSFCKLKASKSFMAFMAIFYKNEFHEFCLKTLFFFVS